MPQLVVDHAHGDDDVAKQLARVRIAEAPFVVQFLNLAYVVQDNTSKQQVPVYARVMLCGEFGQREQAQHMFDQPAQPGMVDRFGRGSELEAPANFFIIEHQIEQRLEMRIRE